jgi:hypothetical protein
MEGRKSFTLFDPHPVRWARYGPTRPRTMHPALSHGLLKKIL